MILKSFTQGTRKFDTLVLGGGGARGVSMLGSLTYLHNNGHLSGVKTFVGTSVGAILAATMALKMDPCDIFHQHVRHFTFEKSVNLMNLEKSFGLDSGKSLDAFIASLIPPKISFRDLYASRGTRLVITVTNVTTAQPEYLSAKTSPDLCIRKALRMSCSVPVFFTAVTHKGSVYVDGGVSDNFPAAHAIELGGKNVLGIRFKSRKPASDTPLTFDRFLVSLLESSVHRASPTGITTLVLGTETQPLNFAMDDATLLMNYNDGYAQTQHHFKKTQ